MDYKQEAEELLSKFRIQARISLGFDSKGYHREGQGTLHMEDSINCAIIALEDKIKDFKYLQKICPKYHFEIEGNTLIVRRQVEYLKSKLK